MPVHSGGAVPHFCALRGCPGPEQSRAEQSRAEQYTIALVPGPWAGALGQEHQGRGERSSRAPVPALHIAFRVRNCYCSCSCTRLALALHSASRRTRPQDTPAFLLSLFLQRIIHFISTTNAQEIRACLCVLHPSAIFTLGLSHSQPYIYRAGTCPCLVVVPLPFTHVLSLVSCPCSCPLSPTISLHPHTHVIQQIYFVPVVAHTAQTTPHTQIYPQHRVLTAHLPAPHRKYRTATSNCVYRPIKRALVSLLSPLLCKPYRTKSIQQYLL